MVFGPGRSRTLLPKLHNVVLHFILAIGVLGSNQAKTKISWGYRNAPSWFKVRSHALEALTRRVKIIAPTVLTTSHFKT